MAEENKLKEKKEQEKPSKEAQESEVEELGRLLEKDYIVKMETPPSRKKKNS